MVLNNTQNEKNQSFNLHLIIKMVLIVGFLIVGIIAILNYLFLHMLARPQIRHITEVVNATSIVVSELAVDSFYDRDREHLTSALNGLFLESNAKESGFLQASVILYPSGIYYASTNKEFMNRKVGLSLLKKIEINSQPGIAVTKLNYEVDQKTIPVLQYLRNINIIQKGKEKRIATTQILFDYGKVLNETRVKLIQVGGIVLVAVIVLIWLLFLPISLAHRKLLEALNQASRQNFEYTLQSKSGDEIGLLFGAYNRLVKQLKVQLSETLTGASGKPPDGSIDRSPASAQQSLRKAEITCLCAKIPDIESTIGEDSPEKVAEYIQDFLAPFDEIVQKFGGQIVKVLGDKVYAFYEGMNSIDNAIRAAIKVNQTWQGLNHERKVLGRDRLNYGIGLHSAMGVAGSLSETHWNYTFFGHASSIAGYLCLCAENEQILVTSSTMDNTSSSFQHKIAEELSPFGLPENEVFLEILSDVASGGMTENVGNTDSADFRTESSDMMMETLSSQQSMQISTSGENDPLRLARKTEEASIPDMLEETLQATPLQSLNPDALNDELPEEASSSNMKGGTFGKDKPVEKPKSLWDQVDQIPGSRKK